MITEFELSSYLDGRHPLKCCQSAAANPKYRLSLISRCKLVCWLCVDAELAIGQSRLGVHSEPVVLLPQLGTRPVNNAKLGGRSQEMFIVY